MCLKGLWIFSLFALTSAGLFLPSPAVGGGYLQGRVEEERKKHIQEFETKCKTYLAYEKQVTNASILDKIIAWWKKERDVKIALATYRQAYADYRADRTDDRAATLQAWRLARDNMMAAKAERDKKPPIYNELRNFYKKYVDQRKVGYHADRNICGQAMHPVRQDIRTDANEVDQNILELPKLPIE